MAEFVKDGFHFTMGQQRGFASAGWRQPAAEETKLWTESAGRGPPGDQGMHTGAATFVFAGKPIGVEPSQKGAVLVVDVVITHLRIPDRDAGLFRHTNAIKPVDERIQSGNDAIEREVGAK